jgi:hypothetical protein
MLISFIILVNFLSFRQVHKIWHAQVAFCVESFVVLDLHCPPPPLPLFLCPIVRGIIIVRNAKG